MDDQNGCSEISKESKPGNKPVEESSETKSNSSQKRKNLADTLGNAEKKTKFVRVNASCVSMSQCLYVCEGESVWVTEKKKWAVLTYWCGSGMVFHWALFGSEADLSFFDNLESYGVLPYTKCGFAVPLLNVIEAKLCIEPLLDLNGVDDDLDVANAESIITDFRKRMESLYENDSDRRYVEEDGKFSAIVVDLEDDDETNFAFVMHHQDYEEFVEWEKQRKQASGVWSLQKITCLTINTLATMNEDREDTLEHYDVYNPDESS
eukprot:jgi/Bigna1/140834/aug1.58_g15542